MLQGRHALGLVALACAACCGACDGSEGAEDDGDGRAPTHEAGPQTCFTPDGASGSPETIADVVAILNGLPKPVSVGCFLQTLDRPLRIEASSDPSSFQPAFGPASPRILVHVGDLVITVVPAGEGRNVVELGEARPQERSTKAELPFPIVGEVLAADPFVRVQDSDAGSKCSVCHTGESVDATIDVATAYTSARLAPLPRYAVAVEELAKQYGWCDPATEAARCDVLDGLFGYGEVLDWQP